MMFGIIVAATLGCVLLIVRFFQPELIYGLREQLIAVRTNRLFLDVEAGKAVSPASFPLLLGRGFRYETRLHDEKYVLNRIVKLRELYRLLVGRFRDDPRLLRGDQQPQVCIRELAKLVENLGRHAVPSGEYQRPVVNATALLRYISNEVRKVQGEGELQTEREIEQWFSEEPISVEQAVEILCAVAFALAYRQRATAKRLRGLPLREERVDYLTEILKFEKRLRMTLRQVYERKYGADERALERLRKVLGAEYFEAALKRMRKVRSDAPDVSLEFLDYLYLNDLKTLIFSEWEVTRSVFQDRRWVSDRLEMIVSVRNNLAHGRSIKKSHQQLVYAYCQELDERLANLSGGESSKTRPSAFEVRGPD
jgi:hypothetical protein